MAETTTTTAMHHEDSIDSQDPNQHPSKKQRSRRPANTAFRQQRLKAWQPILTPKTVLPLFFALGVIFAPIGGALLYASAQVQDLEIGYSRCHVDAPTDAPTQIPSNLVSSSFKTNSSSSFKPGPPTWQRRTVHQTYPSGRSVTTQQCTLTFGVEHDLKPPVLFYYKLTNFYQNHRRYAKSFSSAQLSGDAVSLSTIDDGDCNPLDTVTVNGTEKAYYPCGLAANSQFNDTFSTEIVLLNPQAGQALNGSGNATYTMQNSTDIAWASDKELYGASKYASDWSQVAVPPNWIPRYGDQYGNEPGQFPDLENDAQFQVWMRLAGLPTFSKLAMRNDDDTMSRGTYSIDINSHFNVTEYGGTKSIIISTRTVVGGKNPFLGIAYLVVGGLCIVLGALFTVTHLIKPRKLGDHTYLSWNNTTGGSAGHGGVSGGGAAGAEERATTSGRDGGGR